MSATSEALEQAVTALIEARTALDTAPGGRARAGVDQAFARVAALLAPRIRYFTRAYGLWADAEEAQQACAIAIHRAAERYDPARARFTTYVTWQLRAELQALRLRLRGNPRCGGGNGAATLSLDALVDVSADMWLADPLAEEAAERGAADCLAGLVADRLVADWAERRRSRNGERERTLVRRQLTASEASDRLNESERHVVRRALADIVRHAAEPH
ncbi:sigma factor [Sphingopyxis macrogoltabida]|uniref:RNA polymerase subunit sigma-70 n=1 Tax=Sphingopyxis macrogoltabida TaxID=33050 RepID=A0AAC9AXQ0_SPHMC|nr:sigma factor [Sphingopyxis macrogoltabida]ALJ15676.1 sigma-70 protein [Sphingopyxis macrogoltabida]AMU91917.1 RNA polymerase subunit sigma-70 [Sphingopyxis macrogoltabida]